MSRLLAAAMVLLVAAPANGAVDLPDRLVAESMTVDPRGARVIGVAGGAVPTRKVLGTSDRAAVTRLPLTRRPSGAFADDNLCALAGRRPGGIFRPDSRRRVGSGPIGRRLRDRQGARETNQAGHIATVTATAARQRLSRPSRPGH